MPSLDEACAAWKKRLARRCPTESEEQAVMYDVLREMCEQLPLLVAPAPQAITRRGRILPPSSAQEGGDS